MSLLHKMFSRSPHKESPAILIDGEGVHRYRHGELIEEARWSEMVAISIMTTDEGPFLEDFYWLLIQADGSGCSVPGELAQKHHLLDALQARYGEAFDNNQVIRASGCTDNDTFLCWQAPRKENKEALVPS